MNVSTNEVANRLKITNRAVQIKCKAAGLVKIGNQYQISGELAEIWYKAAETKPAERNEHIKTTSHPKRKYTFSLVSFVIAFLILLTIAISVMFYLDLNSQIMEGKNTITTITKENKIEVKELYKKLNDAHDVIRNQEIEIQTLKFKDSLRVFKN
jgi:hypothetical protein